MTFGDFIRILHAESYGGIRKGATLGSFVRKLFDSANENIGIQIGDRYKNWMKEPNAPGFNSAYTKLFRDDDYNELEFKDEKFLAFIKTNLKSLKNAQSEFKKIKADSDLIDVTTTDENIFLLSVLCQFKEILKMNHDSLLATSAPPPDIVIKMGRAREVGTLNILTAISNTLPFRMHPFIGRHNELQQIHKNFETNQSEFFVQTLLGLGGFGKTETALAYARNHAHEYSNGIGYINSETQQSIQSGFSEFAKTVCHARESLTDSDLRKVVLNWLNTHSSWLLILDNVDNQDKDAHAEILSYVSQLQTGHIIVTTQNSELAMGKAIRIDVFTPEEALEFLADRFDKISYLNLVDSDSGNALTELSWRLGYLPLALEQAVAFMVNSGGIVNCRDYHALLDERGIALFNENLSAPKEYRHTVATTFELSLKKLDSIAAKHFLNLCSYMSPEKIPLAFFQNHSTKFSAELTKALAQPLGINEIIGELVKFSLIKHENGFISIHRMVQDVIRAKIEKDDETVEWLEYCTKAVADEVPHLDEFTDANRLKQFEDIIIPGESILSHVREFVKKYFDTGEHVKMAELFQHELMIYMKILGIDNSSFVIDAVDTYIKIAKAPLLEKMSLMNSDRLAAISHYTNDNFYEALKFFLNDLFKQTSVTTLYPDIDGAIYKLKHAYDILTKTISNGSYTAACELMIGYLEAEAAKRNKT